MPELVANGPRIPASLMNEADSGGVVFFCGAGISAGQESGLPGFAELVKHVYENNGMVPDGVEREALDCDEPNEERRRPAFDKALGLLERPNRLGPRALRSTVIARLSIPPCGELCVHNALIILGRTEHGVRLITTNFDNRFLKADPCISVDTAPKLPVPKRYGWSSLVHLHGRIVEGGDGSNLVLSAADFGRAYLTERWAARFVSELFREFTVVFVGYSVSDPVMSYLVDALAAERGKGARIAKAYAFAHHDGSPEGVEKTRDEWLAKNVEPILYDSLDRHRLLGETLIEWARVRSDPFQARKQIALNGIFKMPAGPEDPVVERMIWALDDPVAAEALALDPPIVDEDEFPKIEKWLEIFQQKGLLKCGAAHPSPGQESQTRGVVQLVDAGSHSQNRNGLDATRRHLALWIAQHMHVPQVLAWVVRNGGHMHPVLRVWVQGNLSHPSAEIAPKLRLLWTVLTNQEPEDPERFLLCSLQYARAASDAERRHIEDAAITSMAPRLTVAFGPTPQLELKRLVEGKNRPIAPIDACGHLRLTIGDDDSRYQVEKIFENKGALARHAETLTSYLEQALALSEEDAKVYADSSLYRPSIAAHDQNRNHEHEGLSCLIDLIRDSYLPLAARERTRAANLLDRWTLSKKPIFRRLGLNALTDDPKSDIVLARKLLVSGRRPGLWERELRREVLRFLRRAGSRLPRSLRTEIVRAIEAGPKAEPKKAPPGDGEPMRREQTLRLYKLASSGARLNAKARKLAGEYQPPPEGEPIERDEFSVWREPARWIGEADLAPDDLLDASIDNIATALRNERVGRLEFRGLATAKPIKVVRALRRLTIDDIWPPKYWQQFLRSIAHFPGEPEPNIRLQDHAAGILAGAPDGLFAGVGSAAAEFVKSLANVYDTSREEAIRELWTQTWNALIKAEPTLIGDPDNPITNALNHPAGKLAEAAMNRLLKYERRVGDGLPEPVRPYFDAIAACPHGHFGRVMLTTRLPYLFALDPEWTKGWLVPLLDPGDSAEASNLWYAYGWSRTIGPDLLQAVKPSFLNVLRDGKVIARAQQNLTMIFIAICLDAPNELTHEEIGSVVDAMSEQNLKAVLECLTLRLTGEPAERARIWHERVGPWLARYWPPAAARNTAATSNAMLNMLTWCGGAFPEAADWSLSYLQPTQGGLFGLGGNALPDKYPEMTLKILDKVVNDEGERPEHRNTLRGILETVRTAMPDSVTTATFQRLYRFATE